MAYQYSTEGYLVFARSRTGLVYENIDGNIKESTDSIWQFSSPVQLDGQLYMQEVKAGSFYAGPCESRALYAFDSQYSRWESIEAGYPC